jgi:mannose-6-phosphate isomerase-like protein (cupin superfamily)
MFRFDRIRSQFCLKGTNTLELKYKSNGNKTVNLKDKFDSFTDYWSPKIVAELNGQLVKVAKFKDEFIMHQHENEDEMFLVIEGKLLMQLEHKTVEINAGEFVVIPKKKPIIGQLLLEKSKFFFLSPIQL